MSASATPITVAILAGGQSRRMGRNKALLTLAGKPLIAHLVARAQTVSDEVIVVTKSPEVYRFLGVPLTVDRYPNVGPLAGLHAALEAAQRPWVVALACDMPFVSPVVVRWLWRLATDVDVVMPRIGGREEPLHAVYRRDVCLSAVEAAIRQGQRRLIAFLDRVRVRYVDEPLLRSVDPQLRSFWNANTPEEWARAVALWQAMTGRKGSSAPGSGEA